MTKAMQKALDDARDAVGGVRDDGTRRILALLVAILRRLADKPHVEQPIAPEPPEAGETPTPH